MTLHDLFTLLNLSIGTLGHEMTQLHYRYFLIIVDFTTHGESYFYGLPCPSVDSLDRMDHFCTFDVSKIIPKNMQKFPYVTFKPFLAYIRKFGPPKPRTLGCVQKAKFFWSFP